MAGKDGTTTHEALRAVQITLWLGVDQEVDIKLSKTLGKRLVPGDLDFERSGFASRPSKADLAALVPEILQKLLIAFPKKEPITLDIDKFDQPVPSST